MDKKSSKNDLGNISTGDETVSSQTFRRSSGPLTSAEVGIYRAAGRALAYDPVQIGWVPADCVDDMDMMFKPAAGPRYARLRTDQDHAYALRPWRLADLETYHTLLDDPEVWRFMPEPYPKPLSRDDASALIELSSSSGHHEVHAVLHDGEPIGQLRLQFGSDGQNHVAELSYWLGRAHWGKGHGAAMVRTFSERVLSDHPDLDGLLAKVHDDNTASRRILAAAGFKITDIAGEPSWQWYRLTR